MCTNQNTNYDIQVNLENGKICYFNSKKSTNISFFGPKPNIKIEKTTYFGFPDYEIFDPENYLSNICSLELNVSQICNMSCTYCFATSGTYGNSGIMLFETAKKAIDLLYNISKKNRISIKFFGGEPFLNFNLIKEVVEYVGDRFNGYDVDFQIATNGTIITEEILELIKNYSFSIQVSLDGNQLSHNKYRTFLDGTPTYELIISNLEKMREAGIEPQIRTTFCHKSEKITDFLLYYINNLNLQVNVSPVMSKDENVLLNQEDIDTIYQEYLDIFKDTIESRKYKGVLFNKVLREMILYCFETENLTVLTPRPYFCGAGLRMLSIDIAGNIYPCHGFIGHDQFNLGNVDTNIDQSKLKQFLDRIHIANKKECLNCIARNFCGGGCSHYFYETNDNISLPHEGFCGFVKTFYKLAIIFYVNMKEKRIPKELLKSSLYIELNDILLDNEEAGPSLIYS